MSWPLRELRTGGAGAGAVDGNAGRLDFEPESGGPGAAVWDGAGYLFAMGGELMLSVGPDGTLANPDFDAGFILEPALATAKSGYSLRAGVVQSETAPRRLVAQSLNRADAEVCDVP